MGEVMMKKNKKSMFCDEGRSRGAVFSTILSRY